jgi:putative aldouronate transport system substrate-binding protein
MSMLGKKKWFSSVFILSLSTVFFAACSNGGATNETGKTAGEKSDKVGPPVKLQIMTQSFGVPLPSEENNLVKQVLKEKTNVEIEMINPPDAEYRTQVNARLAGADFPDLFKVENDQIQQFGKQGLLLDLTPYLDKELKAVKDYLGEADLLKGTVEGKVYALPKKPAIPYGNLWIRKDWLDNLKLSVPSTLEELQAVATAFTEKDPDGNNQKDTYGYGGMGLTAFNPILGAFGVGGINDFYAKDGKLIYSPMDPDMKAAIEFIKQFMKSGAVDPDLLTTTSEANAAKKAFQGKIGILNIGFPNMTAVQYVEEYKTVNPKAEWIQVAPPKGPKGAYSGAWDVAATPGMHAIPKSLEKDPDKLQKVFDLLGYIATPEGADLVAHGVEGRHWKVENGLKVRLEARKTEHFWAYQLLGRDEVEYLKPGYPPKDVEMSAKTPRIQSFNSYLSYPEGYNHADSTRYVTEELVKFIYGKRQLNEYDAFLQTLNTTFKFNLMLDAANKRVDELKLIK